MDPNPGLLQEQPVLLTTKPGLQSPTETLFSINFIEQKKPDLATSMSSIGISGYHQCPCTGETFGLKQAVAKDSHLPLMSSGRWFIMDPDSHASM